MNGWILDLHPGDPGEMVVWLKEGRGRTTRLVDRWAPSFYAACDSRDELEALSTAEWLKGDIEEAEFVKRRERITDVGQSEVLRLKVRDAKAMVRTANKVERSKPFGFYRIYNPDVPPAQTYLYERDLFPLAYCSVQPTGDSLAWTLMDDAWSCDYPPPPLSSAFLQVDIDKHGSLATQSDAIKEIRLKFRDEVVIDSGPEAEKLLGLVKAVKAADPDIIFTEGGDSFLLRYLFQRAEACGISDQLSLGRDEVKLEIPAKEGTSFFSYGKINYRSSTVWLRGRIHVDMANSFSVSEVGLYGFYELSRTCRMPLHTSSRASIGRALSSLQFYHAHKEGLLVPWKPTLAEHFKSRLELLVADRGGFIFEPRVGLHEGVAEFDYSALFPNIMLKKNISGETVHCDCCPDSTNRVPELGWNVCEKRVGVVPKSMEIIVGKRLAYKKLKKEATTEAERAKYDGRQMALKWIGVTCLPKETPVLVREDGQVKSGGIGDFIDRLVGDKAGAIDCPPDVFVAGADHEMKAKFCRVGKLLKIPNHARLLEIKMEDGRKICATTDHLIYVLDSAELKVKSADELKPGDLVPVAKRAPVQSEPESAVDLIERLSSELASAEQELWRVSGDVIKERARANKQNLIHEAMARGYARQAPENWVKTGVIPLRFLPLLKVSPELHDGLKIGVGRRMGGRMGWMPAVLPLDERLGFFLGLYVADGSAGENFIRLDIGESEPDLLREACDVTKSLFGLSPRVYKEKKAKMHVVQVNCATLVRALENVFGLPGSAARGKLRVPEIIFNSSQKTGEGFIQGLIAGDGHASKRRGFVNIASASQGFRDQIAFLCASLGLSFRNAQQRENGHPLYTINLVGPETLERVANWPFVRDSHRSRPSDRVGRGASRRSVHPTYIQFPVRQSGLLELARSARTVRTPRIDKNFRVWPDRAEELINRIERRTGISRELQKAKKLLLGDFGFVRVREVRESERDDEFVYCFQMDDAEVPGFFAGGGLIYVSNCFGYLGFNNAKFGRIDAHISVCAWDRKILLDSARLAETRGFRVIHGIVDSLWVKKEGADEAECMELRAEIEKGTGFDLSFEGLYKWIAFVPSKLNPSLPVANRYFGVYQNGELKIRGIEARRHDTPPFFVKCQKEMLDLLAKASGADEARRMVPGCVSIFDKYAHRIMGGEVPVEELAISRSLSKSPSEYVTNTLEASASANLEEAGLELHPGQGVRYVIADYGSTSKKYRAVPLQLLGHNARYDRKRYVELLGEAAATIIEPFDPTMAARYRKMQSEPAWTTLA